MPRTDLLVDANGDLPIYLQTTMPVGVSDGNIQRDMFNAHPGEWKQFPLNGIGISSYLKSSSNQILTLKSKARQMLQRDGYNPGNITITFDASNKMLINTRTA